MKKFVFALMAILLLSVFSIAACQKTGTQTALTDQQTQPAQETLPDSGAKSDSDAGPETSEQKETAENQEAETAGNQKTETQPAPQQSQEAPEAAVKEFNVQAFRFGFNPSAIEVNKGDKVKITLTSSDTTHGFSISEYSISETISPGQTKTVEFTADKEGTFAFFCSVYCGSGHGGMRGTLIVR